MKEEKIYVRLLKKGEKSEIVEAITFNVLCGLYVCKRKNGEHIYCRLDEIEFLPDKKEAKKWNFSRIARGIPKKYIG